MLTLTPFGPDGQFNNYLISVLVNNWEVRSTLIRELLYTIEEKGFQGVDIDFEFILADDKSEPYGTRRAPVFSRNDCRALGPLYASPQPPAQASWQDDEMVPLGGTAPPVPYWLLDAAQRICQYMDAHYHGDWVIGGIQKRQGDK